ncbi:MAG: hypothetical protein ACOCUH_01285, partial [Bacteriovoracia bacterium]
TKLTIPVFALPTFSATLHNSAARSFNKVGDNETPEDIKQNLVLGLSLTPQVGKYTRVHIGVDYKDAAHKHKNLTFTRRLGLGLEFDFARTMFVRFGYGDGFGSAGIGIKSKKLQVDLTTYAVDTTSNEFRGKEDRRFVFSISSGI